jgi:hypothetical protein
MGRVGGGGGGGVSPPPDIWLCEFFWRVTVTHVWQPREAVGGSAIVDSMGAWPGVYMSSP